MKNFPIAVLLVAATFVGALAQAQPANETTRLTLEDIYASRKFSGERFSQDRWSEAGPVVTFAQPDQASGATHLVSFDLETGDRSILVDGRQLEADDVGRLIGIDGYEYSDDWSKILLYTDSERVWRLNTKGFYYIYDTAGGSLTPLSDRKSGFQMFAKLSPDATRAAFVRDRNLFMVNLESGEETQLTFTGGEGTVINGTSDWVYEEEFGLRDGWSWSPDGRHIAFFQLDESNTRDFSMMDYRSLYPKTETFRYPKAGEVNSEIRIGVVDVEQGVTLFFETGTWYAGGDSLEYIPQMGWTPAIDGRHMVWMFRMDRDQNDLEVLYGNPETGDVTVILDEKEDTWIEVETGFSDLDVGNLTYLDDNRHFVWLSEVDGYRHLYLYGNDGTFVRQLTSGSWDVTEFHGVDEDKGKIYFSATIESPLERHLYALDLRQESARAPVRITGRHGWHDVSLSADKEFFIDKYSNATTPLVATLHRIDGSSVSDLAANEELIATIDSYDLPEPEFMTVPGADGTDLNAFMIKPSSFDESRSYPVLMYVYGGPGSQTVRDQWGGSRYLWHSYMADDLDLIVVSVDNRGTGGRGKAFKSETYKQLGLLEAADQVAAAKHLGTMPYLDAERIGIWGWSYGGYATLLSMLTGDGPETIKFGVSVAPVTTYRLYDTIYTERYMSTPQKNPKGYDDGAPINYAHRMSDDQKLLIVHGDFDDNVHYQNAILMVDALVDANKQFDFMVYPGRNHGIYGGNTSMHLFTMITNFIRERVEAEQPETRLP